MSELTRILNDECKFDEYVHLHVCKSYMNRKLRVLNYFRSRIAYSLVQALEVKQLFRQIRLIWRFLSQDYAIKLVENMPRRCHAIINNKGDWITY